ncbi:uncharacterized protein DS421_8g223480 [Arachis hypogaea]|nr:uncharacterized protein DS421_8g223480 [Arachis hypogaea]
MKRLFAVDIGQSISMFLLSDVARFLYEIAHTLPVSLNNVGGVFVGACSVLMRNFWDAHSTETLLESDISVGYLLPICYFQRKFNFLSFKTWLTSWSHICVR